MRGPTCASCATRPLPSCPTWRSTCSACTARTSPTTARSARASSRYRTAYDQTFTTMISSKVEQIWFVHQGPNKWKKEKKFNPQKCKRCDFVTFSYLSIGVPPKESEYLSGYSQMWVCLILKWVFGTKHILFWHSPCHHLFQYSFPYVAFWFRNCPLDQVSRTLRKKTLFFSLQDNRAILISSCFPFLSCKENEIQILLKRLNSLRYYSETLFVFSYDVFINAKTTFMKMELHW